jgi:hypothetical protein
MVLVVVCAALWGASTVYQARAGQTLDSERQALASLEEERSELTARRGARREFTTIYRQLLARGIVGNDQRLAWVQNTRDAGNALDLPYLRYTTSPQRALEAPWMVPGVSAPVMVNPMEVQLGVVHEKHLLRLFDLLSDSPGVFQVESCTLERLGHDTRPEPDKANITGTCQLAWYSVPRETTLLAANPEN